MVTLYAVPFACSANPHMVLEALGIPYQLKTLKWGGTPELWKELEEINPTKQVPTIKTQEGYILTEGAAIVQYLSDLKGGALMPKGEGKYRALEWLNFISTDLHKGFSPLFNAKNWVSDESAQKDLLQKVSAKLAKALGIAESRISPAGFCIGSQITLPDYYLATVLSWAPFVKFDLSPFPKLQALSQKVWATPEGQKVLASAKN